MEDKLPFALKNGLLVDVSKVERGLECNCICPACKERLIARKGNNIIHHFAHYKNSNCRKGLESGLHIAGKELLERAGFIHLPEVTAKLGMGNNLNITLLKEQIIRFDKVLLEKTIDTIVPDIIIEVNGTPLFIEIAVTHFADNNKRVKIGALKISAIEIDLSSFFERFSQFSFTDLEKALIYRTDYKKWLYNTKLSMFEKSIEQLTKEYNIINHGSTPHVHGCPIAARSWNGNPYAELIEDSSRCKHYCGSKRNDQALTHIFCLGHAKPEVDRIIEHYKR